jgi:hypothetical protein
MFKRVSLIRGLIGLVLGLILGLANSPVLAANSLPQPNDMGDYSGNLNHLYWQVVDPDPEGLNCRMGQFSIREVWSLDNSGYPEIGSWPVVTTLEKDDIFQAQRTYAGFVVTFDQNLNPWIFIKNKSDGTPANCFVRANTAFVQPIAESEFKQTASVNNLDTENFGDLDEL